MSPRPASAFVLCLLLLGLALPVSGQQEDAEQTAAGDDAGQGDGEGDAMEPPSVTMVHYGPDSAGGSLASLYPDQAMELGQGEAAFTGLMKPAETAERHGGLLIIAPSGQSPDQGLAGAIRTQLPKAGWMTLSIAQPAEPVAELPERVLEPEPANEGDEGQQADTGADGNAQAGDDGGAGDGEEETGEEAVDAPDMTIQVAQGSDGATGPGEDWQTRATDRLEAAVNALRDEGGDVTVLVGIGDGADLILRYARANGATFPQDGLAMVWLDARLRPPFNNGLGAELGEGYPVPVLDLYDRDHGGDRAEKRSAAARRGGFAAYTQSALPLPRGSGAREQRRVPARIRGWLHGLFVAE